jgi:hypothetical protein
MGLFLQFNFIERKKKKNCREVNAKTAFLFDEFGPSSMVK